MISLRHLPLAIIAEHHHEQLQEKINKRFTAIEAYFLALNGLIGSVDAAAQAKLLLNGFREGIAKKLMLAEERDHHDLMLHETHMDILAALKPKLEITLKGGPNQIDALVDEIKVFLLPYVETGTTKFSYLKNIKSLISGLEYIWDYDNFIKKDRQKTFWDAYSLSERLKVSTCPYCNRIYTLSIVVEEEGLSSAEQKITRPEFDHFYSKARYPFLGLAFYNLVPSCSICNSTIKGEREMSIKDYCHPYLEGYEDLFSFRTGVDLRDYLSKKVLEIPVKLEAQPSPDKNKAARAENTHAFFRIGEIYPFHHDIAEEFFKKATMESKGHIEGYWNQRSPNGNYLYSSRGDLYRHYVGNFISKRDFYRRPLAKFYYDLAEEAKILEKIKSLPHRPDPNSSVDIEDTGS